ncbi:fungal-specific transcription factor domain-containing protein [Aspergillus cavernicola]|uniref:Fungal-specific transcription factor domain-containing protein n=1 Tax=Aspergillus cavernicola TaxID=176166 RepID=A0ABR4I0Z0_9EURO
MSSRQPLYIAARSAAKQKRHRTRSGCLVCKRRKVKCDEAKPSCGHCRARGFSCNYDRNNDAGNVSTTPWRSPLESVENGITNSSVEEPLAQTFCAQMTRNIIRSVDCPGNPHLDVFKSLMQSQTVLHALQALANLHHSASSPGEVARGRTASLKHQGTAIQLLKRDLQNIKLANSDAVLAATILLYLFEKAYDAENETHSSYFEGARVLIHQRFFTVKDLFSQVHEVSWATRVLVKTFAWHNVMTIVSKPFLFQDRDVDILRLTDLLNVKSDQNLYLLGWAKDAFWLMTDLAAFTQSLLPLAESMPANEESIVWRMRVLPRAMRVEKRLKAYTVTLDSVKYYMGRVEVSEETTTHCLATIELLRRTSLLYLYQVMPDLMPSFLVDELAHDLLQHLQGIPKESPMIAYHGWILLTVGAQCLDPKDRGLVLERLEFSHGRFQLSSVAANATRLLLEVSILFIFVRYWLTGRRSGGEEMRE